MSSQHQLIQLFNSLHPVAWMDPYNISENLATLVTQSLGGFVYLRSSQHYLEHQESEMHLQQWLGYVNAFRLPLFL